MSYEACPRRSARADLLKGPLRAEQARRERAVGQNMLGRGQALRGVQKATSPAVSARPFDGMHAHAQGAAVLELLQARARTAPSRHNQRVDGVV
jgi:hypothetical protein